MKHSFDTSVYRRYHGAEPCGRGTWVFVFGGRFDGAPTGTEASALCERVDAPTFTVFNETFSKAKTLATSMADARRCGATLIVVMP